MYSNNGIDLFLMLLKDYSGYWAMTKTLRMLKKSGQEPDFDEFFEKIEDAQKAYRYQKNNESEFFKKREEKLKEKLKNLKDSPDDEF